MAFRSVFVDGKITNPKTQKSADLRLFGENKIPYVSSVSLSVEWGVDTQFSISLTPTYEKALELISKTQEWFRFGNSVALRWGYSDAKGAFSDWHMGMMLMPEVSFGEDINITIPIMSYGWSANRVEGTQSLSTSKKPKTFIEVANEIAKIYGMEVEYYLNTERAKALLETKRVFQQYGRTDLQFMMIEAQSAGVYLVVKNNKYIFIDDDATSGDPQVSATFSMYGKIDIANNIYPLNSFNPSALGPLFLSNYQGVFNFFSGPNSDPKEEPELQTADGSTSDANSYSAKTTLNAPPKDEKGERCDAPPPKNKTSDGTENLAKVVVKADPAQMRGGKYLPLPSSSEFMEKYSKEILSACGDSEASDQGLSVEFESIALPFITPGMYVGIEGVGDYFSTVYKLTSQEITIDSGGANMSCKAGPKGMPGIDFGLDVFGDNAKKSVIPTKSKDAQKYIMVSAKER